MKIVMDATAHLSEGLRYRLRISRVTGGKDLAFPHCWRDARAVEKLAFPQEAQSRLARGPAVPSLKSQR